MKLVLISAVFFSLMFFGCVQEKVNSQEGGEDGYLSCGGIANAKCPEGFVCANGGEEGKDGYCMPQYVDPPRYDNGTLNVPS